MQNQAEVLFPGHVFKLRSNQIAASGFLLLNIFCQLSLHELETEMWLHKITLKILFHDWVIQLHHNLPAPHYGDVMAEQAVEQQGQK